jgi:hypothetical protein
MISGNGRAVRRKFDRPGRNTELRDVKPDDIRQNDLGIDRSDCPVAVGVSIRFGEAGWQRQTNNRGQDSLRINGAYSSVTVDVAPLDGLGRC